MRSIKPYVLSKILADRSTWNIKIDLTEKILELGKIKPNKSRRDQHLESFEEFNETIAKLYKINSEYEAHKNNKKKVSENSVHSNNISGSSASLSSSEEEMQLSKDSHIKKEKKTEQSLQVKSKEKVESFDVKSRSSSPSKSPRKIPRLRKKKSKEMKPELGLKLQ